LRAIIFANGLLSMPDKAGQLIQPGDLVIAADGGLLHCQALGILPEVLIGDFDSIPTDQLASMHAQGVQVIQHPSRKDHTDLELALQHAHHAGVDEIILLGALGARWDQTLANLLLPTSSAMKGVRISILEGNQEICFIDSRSTPEALEIQANPGDTLSLIPLGGDALGITTHGLEFPLHEEVLLFGATRGISNVFRTKNVRIDLKQGLLVCIISHQE
jgi:thiamine pyrophosphokinase